MTAAEAVAFTGKEVNDPISVVTTDDEIVAGNFLSATDTHIVVLEESSGDVRTFSRDEIKTIR